MMRVCCCQALQAVAIVRSAVERYAPTPNCLTAMHADLIQVGHILSIPQPKMLAIPTVPQLCLVAKCLKPALPFLEREYTQLLTEVRSCCW